MENSNSTCVLQKYFNCLTNGDLDGLKNVLNQDIVWHQPGKGELSKDYKGRQQVFSLFEEFMRRSQNSFRITKVGKIMGNGEFASADVHFEACANGKCISMDGIDMVRVKDGTIAETWLFSADQEYEDAFWSMKEQGCCTSDKYKEKLSADCCTKN